MTHTEILQASLLDLLFDRRNKQYGAYTLRKFYPGRLRLALGITLGGVLLAGTLFSSFRPVHSKGGPIADQDTVILQMTPDEVPDEVPEPTKPVPPPVRQAVQSAHYTSNIVLTNGPTDVAAQDRIAVSAVGPSDVDGPQATPEVQVVAPPITALPGVATDPAPEAPVALGPTEAPSFPGGDRAWLNFLLANLQPTSSMEPGERRSVLVRFWVDEDGSVTRFAVERSAGDEFDREVLRVLRKMPRWKPALQNGRPVATSFRQPVTFQAPEE